MDTRKNTCLVILSAAVLGLGALSWHQHTQLSLMRSQPTPLVSQQTVSRQSAPHAPMVLPQSESLHGDPQPDEAETTEPVTRPNQKRRDAIGAIKELPEYKQLEQTVIRERLANEFAGLFYQLGLGPKEQSDFLDLLVEKQLIGRDAIALARAQGFTFRQDEEALRALINENMAEMDQVIRDKFGAPAFETYENYQETRSIRQLANTLDRKLSYSSSPIDTVQKERLIQLIAQSPDQEVPYRGYGLLSTTSMNMARGMLTPDQFAALEEIQTEYLARARMREMVNSALQKASSP